MTATRDWSKEPWKKLFCGPDFTWDRFPWEAQALWMFLLRACESHGRITLSGYPAFEAMAAISGMPLDLVELGADELTRAGWVAWDADAIELAGYVEQQGARTSGAERQRRYRQRLKEQPRRDVTSDGGDVTRDVTRDEATSHRDERKKERIKRDDRNGSSLHEANARPTSSRRVRPSDEIV